MRLNDFHAYFGHYQNQESQEIDWKINRNFFFYIGLKFYFHGSSLFFYGQCLWVIIAKKIIVILKVHLFSVERI